MDGGEVYQPSSAGAGVLVGFDSLQESRGPLLHTAFASEKARGVVRPERPATSLTARPPAAVDAMFTQFGIAESERTPPWLRPRVATVGRESRLSEASLQPESPVTLHSRSDASVAAPAERVHRRSERWEPLEDLLSLLADQTSDRLLNPREALFAQAGR